MRRRTFIELVPVLIFGTAGPFVVRAQQPAKPVIGFLNVASPELFATRIAAFSSGLSEFCFVDGTYGFFDSQSGKLGAMAARLAIPAI